MASGLRVEARSYKYDGGEILDVLITFPSKYNNVRIGGMCDWNDWPEHNGERYKLVRFNEKVTEL